MDGNRRWAQRAAFPRSRATAAVSSRCARDARRERLGIARLTVYGFSTENWNRDANEISLLFDLCVISPRTNWRNSSETTFA